MKEWPTTRQKHVRSSRKPRRRRKEVVVSWVVYSEVAKRMKQPTSLYRFVGLFSFRSSLTFAHFIASSLLNRASFLSFSNLASRCEIVNVSLPDEMTSPSVIYFFLRVLL
ncbi:unnamed protein product [Anisakis simplex]|uniref:Uncharacterized protein n=1 Tax=Anisakis simplex TaxID=6269 RepID=A0A3P6NII2_ANISI|nr:unnamed protein product [Anisakis simplex]